VLDSHEADRHAPPQTAGRGARDDNPGQKHDMGGNKLPPHLEAKRSSRRVSGNTSCANTTKTFGYAPLHSGG